MASSTSEARMRWRPLPRRTALAALAAAAALTLGAPRTDAIVCNTPCTPSGSDKVVLALYYNHAMADHITAAHGDSITTATNEGYVFVRNEAIVYKNYKPGLIPLRLMKSADDYFTVASGVLLQGAYIQAAWKLRRIEGWIHPTQVSGTVPIFMFYSFARNDFMLTATAAGIASARAA